MTKNTQVSIEDVGSLIAWLIEQAIQAADADQPRDAGMLTWAAQVIGECVDEDAPDPPAAPDDKEPASVVGEPSDEELLGLDQLAEAWNAQADAANDWDELGLDEIIVWAQRQALARWGHQSAPPAEGKVGEPVAVGQPTDAELLELYPLSMTDLDDAFAFARAVLARWGHQPAPPGNKNTPASPESTEMNRD